MVHLNQQKKMGIWPVSQYQLEQNSLICCFKMQNQSKIASSAVSKCNTRVKQPHLLLQKVPDRAKQPHLLLQNVKREQSSLICCFRKYQLEQNSLICCIKWQNQSKIASSAASKCKTRVKQPHLLLQNVKLQQKSLVCCFKWQNQNKIASSAASKFRTRVKQPHLLLQCFASSVLTRQTCT